MASKVRTRPAIRHGFSPRWSLYKATASVMTALTLSPGFAAAATCNWLPATGNWATSGNWSCGLVPSGPAADTATIALGRTSTINSAQSIFTLNNAGSININAFSLTLQSGGSTTNSGTINVGGPLTAAMQVSHNINNAGGLISVSDGSFLNQLAASINGGTITTAGTGALVSFSSAANVLSGVTLNGLLDVASNPNARERIANGFTLNGTATVANGGILSLDGSLTPGGNQAIAGNGTIRLNDAAARLAVEGAGTTTLASTITVRGRGNIGQAAFAAGNHTLVNNGLISADVAGGTLNVTNPANGSLSSLVNNGTLRATNGGRLQLSTNVNFAGTNQVVADAGSLVVQNGVQITGVINSSGTGLSASSSSSNVLSGVTFNGALDVASIANARERIANGLTLSGTATVANGGILSLDGSLTPGGNQTIAGNGTIRLNDAAARLAVEGAGTTTLASTITVRGQGNIGQAAFAAGNHTLVNNGLISADVSGGTLNLTNPANGPASSVTNRGTVEAVNGATLAVAAAMTNANGGTMTAGAGSLIHLQTASFVNRGLIQGNGVVRTLNATATLANEGHVAPGVDSIGTLTLNGQYSQTATGALDIGINSLTSFDALRVNGAASLNGTLDLFCVGNCSLAVGDEITVLDASSLTGTFSNLALFGFGSGQFTVQYDVLNGDVKLLVTQTVTAVPMPPTAWLLISGLAGVGLAKRASMRPRQVRKTSERAPVSPKPLAALFE